MKQSKKLVLASGSPRRKDLLEMLGLDFKVVLSNFEEKMEGMKADKLAIFNAEGKALNVSESEKDSLVLGVDTVVSLNEHILGKPKDKKDALRILKLLSGSIHEVISGICIVDSNSGKKISKEVRTKIFMDEMSEKEMMNYIESGEGKDKAAGYAIQGIGAKFVKGIVGDYFNVVGLPIYELRKILQEFDFNV